MATLPTFVRTMSPHVSSRLSTLQLMMSGVMAQKLLIRFRVAGTLLSGFQRTKVVRSMFLTDLMRRLDRSGQGVGPIKSEDETSTQLSNSL